MHRAWRASTLGDRILFRAAVLDRTIWDADHPQHRVIPTRVFGLSQSIEIDCTQGKEFRQSVTGAPLLASGGSKTSNGWPCSLPKVGKPSLLTGMMGQVCWGPAGGVARVLCPAFVGFSRGGLSLPTPGFLLPALQKWQLDVFFCLCTFWSRICPNCACTGLFLVPCSLFVFCCWRRDVSGANFAALQLRVPGPSLSQWHWWVSLTSPSETTSDQFSF